MSDQRATEVRLIMQFPVPRRGVHHMPILLAPRRHLSMLHPVSLVMFVFAFSLWLSLSSPSSSSFSPSSSSALPHATSAAMTRAGGEGVPVAGFNPVHFDDSSSSEMEKDQANSKDIKEKDGFDPAEVAEATWRLAIMYV